MAAKKPTVTVQIGFNVETESLNKIAKKLKQGDTTVREKFPRFVK